MQIQWLSLKGTMERKIIMSMLWEEEKILQNLM